MLIESGVKTRERIPKAGQTPVKWIGIPGESAENGGRWEPRARGARDAGTEDARAVFAGPGKRGQCRCPGLGAESTPCYVSAQRTPRPCCLFHPVKSGSDQTLL